MKLILLALFVALCGSTFVDFLSHIQNHATFQRLSPEEKLLFGELIVAAENSELTEFIDRVGLGSVLKLMDHMSSSDAAQFSAYLAEHSNYTHHAHGTDGVIDKRDDDDHHTSLTNLLEHHHGSIYEHLPNQEKAILNDLIHAARHHHLTRFIETNGYGPIFGVLEHVQGGDAAHAIIDTLELALVAEQSGADTAIGKRQDSHSHFSNFLESINSHYYEHLPEPERQTYHAILDAVHAKNLTGYLNDNGYGAVFGMLEHLDYIHADQFYQYIGQALEDEAAIAAAAAN